MWHELRVTRILASTLVRLCSLESTIIKLWPLRFRRNLILLSCFRLLLWGVAWVLCMLPKTGGQDTPIPYPNMPPSSSNARHAGQEVPGSALHRGVGEGL